MQRVICHDDAITDVDSGLDTDEEAVENENGESSESSKSRPSSTRQSTAAVCYVCYDETEDDNPLIAPCKCTGDTKYIHLNCLKRWNTNGEKNDICTVFDESNARTCSICKAPYPSKTRLPNGKSISLLPDRLPAPTIMFQVVTKHSSSTLNLSTRYQLSYKMLLHHDIHRPLMVGRSSQCDLVLKYRTVSTIHAEIHYSKGEFYLKDAGSSNGTLRYIYRPLNLQNNQSLHVKFGRTVLSIKPTKKIRLPHFFGGANSNSNGNQGRDYMTEEDTVGENVTASIINGSSGQHTFRAPPSFSQPHQYSQQNWGSQLQPSSNNATPSIPESSQATESDASSNQQHASRANMSIEDRLKHMGL
jgi:hypothetical protein